MLLRVLILLSLFLTVTYGAAYAGGPCNCEDIKNIRDQIARVSKAEKAWQQILKWAKGLFASGKPQTNEDMNNMFSQLMTSPTDNWEDIMSKPAQSQNLTKIGGLDEKGEVIINEEFERANCDDIVESERVHERQHREFFLRFENILEAHPGPGTDERLLKLRAESEVESYRAQKEFLQKALEKLKKKCPVLEFHSIITGKMPMFFRSEAKATVYLKKNEITGYTGSTDLSYVTTPSASATGCPFPIVSGTGKTRFEVASGQIPDDTPSGQTIALFIRVAKTAEDAVITCPRAARRDRTSAWGGLFNVAHFTSFDMRMGGIPIRNWDVTASDTELARKTLRSTCNFTCQEEVTTLILRYLHDDEEIGPGSSIPPPSSFMQR